MTLPRDENKIFWPSFGTWSEISDPPPWKDNTSKPFFGKSGSSGALTVTSCMEIYLYGVCSSSNYTGGFIYEFFLTECIIMQSSRIMQSIARILNSFWNKFTMQGDSFTTHSNRETNKCNWIMNKENPATAGSVLNNGSNTQWSKLRKPHRWFQSKFTW